MQTVIGLFVGWTRELITVLVLLLLINFGALVLLKPAHVLDIMRWMKLRSLVRTMQYMPGNFHILNQSIYEKIYQVIASHS